MKKISYFALAVISMTLFACTSKPAATDQSSNEAEYVEETNEDVLLYDEIDEAAPAESPAEAEEATLEPAGESEQEAVEKTPAEPEAPAKIEEPAKAKKYPIDNSDGNFVAMQREVVTADAEGCVEVATIFDKPEESVVRLVIEISKADGQRIGLFPMAIAPGGTKAETQICASTGPIFSVITAGEQYRLAIVRAKI